MWKATHDFTYKWRIPHQCKIGVIKSGNPELKAILNIQIINYQMAHSSANKHRKLGVCCSCFPYNMSTNRSHWMTLNGVTRNSPNLCIISPNSVAFRTDYVRVRLKIHRNSLRQKCRPNNLFLVTYGDIGMRSPLARALKWGSPSR